MIVANEKQKNKKQKGAHYEVQNFSRRKSDI